MKEPRARSLIKTLTWRVTGSASTLFISYVLTGNVKVAGSIAGVQVVVNMILYYFHERLWSKIKWNSNQTR